MPAWLLEGLGVLGGLALALVIAYVLLRPRRPLRIELTLWLKRAERDDEP